MTLHQIVDIGVLFVLVVIGNLTATWIVRTIDQRKKRIFLENFFGHIQEKLNTEAEFNEIVEKLRKDYNGDE